MTLLNFFINKKEKPVRAQTTFEKLTADGEFSLDLSNSENRKLIMQEIDKFKDFDVDVKKSHC
ncbi:hypothetical protein [uncultured Shewanella sp.]|uniref:hypothetical protein n=1 Tax=uncultured Shewanella sp. TaxID=173975 RepID=UPI002611EB02|nr:hypothetical protein [uncultured Shewanella sp.]